MITWDTFKRAAQEYSRWRPRLVQATFTPTIGSKQQLAPTDAVGVLYVDYGLAGEPLEVINGDGSTQAWSYEGTSLWLDPAPTTDDPIAIVYAGLHAPDEGTESYPTIPLAHLPYVEDLERAYVLEREAEEIENGPVRYVVGQTEIDRTTAAAGKRQQAAQLRQAVLDQLGGPVAVWG